MKPISDQNNPDLSPGQRIGGYRLLRVVALGEIESIFYEFLHERTGARHAHVSRKDGENTFSVAFKTVPADSTGIAHILEHTALCGSEKYNVRDPFFSMLKRSLSTFMNAFTASDWTMYPFSTQNKKDFYNLLDVYLDAAFFPNLSELSFKQEGHRLELENGDGDKPVLRYKGVVYNEMKGAMSSPDQIMARSLKSVLYPNTTYRFNSGGDPEQIPRLTHEDLKKFHQRHYHPSNAYFYTYGDLPIKEHLEFIEKRILSRFDKIDPRTEVPSQPRWSEPRTATHYYPLSKSEAPEKKSQVAVAWLASDVLDTFEVLVLAILEQILMGNPASPLRRALIDSGLGTSLADASGFNSEYRDTMFSCGLKNVSLSSVEKIESIIFQVLEELVKNGIESELVQSAIHQMEFHRKEVTNHPYPYGLKLLLEFGGSWFHGADPVRILQFDKDLQKLRDSIASGPFLENQIKKYFLKNPHRVLFKLVPDQELSEKREKKETEELEKIQSALSEEQIQKIRSDSEALQRLQETPENVSVLPTLSLTDISPKVRTLAETSSSDTAMTYRQPTSGIFYFSSAIGAGTIPENLLPLVPFFCSALTRIGTEKRDYAEMARRIDAYTGGVNLTSQARTSYGDLDLTGPGNCLPFITLGGKCLVRNIEKMFEIIEELVLQFSFGDLKRLKNLLLEYRTGLESMIVQNGHRLAISAASSNFSLTGALNENWHGIRQVKAIKALTDDLYEERLKKVSSDLARIAKELFHRDNIKIALIGEEEPLMQAIALAEGFGKKLPESKQDGFRSPDISLDNGAVRQGWRTSTAVSFVARSFDTVRMGHEDAPALSVIAKMMRSLFLHREVREKGGAYGGFSIFSPEDGQFCLASYRDPRLVSTLDVYDRAMEFIRSGLYNEKDIKEAVLQVCSEIDKPDPPGPAARKAFYRKLLGLQDQVRMKHKQALLKLNREKVMAVAEKYFKPGRAEHSVAVISSGEKLKSANERLKNPLALNDI